MHRRIREDVLACLAAFEVDEEKYLVIAVGGQRGFGDDGSEIPEIFGIVFVSAPCAENYRLSACLVLWDLRFFLLMQLGIVVVEKTKSGSSLRYHFGQAKSRIIGLGAFIYQSAPIDVVPVD